MLKLKRFKVVDTEDHNFKMGQEVIMIQGYVVHPLFGFTIDEMKTYWGYVEKFGRNASQVLDPEQVEEIEDDDGETLLGRVFIRPEALYTFSGGKIDVDEPVEAIVIETFADAEDKTQDSLEDIVASLEEDFNFDAEEEDITEACQVKKVSFIDPYDNKLSSMVVTDAQLVSKEKSAV